MSRTFITFKWRVDGVLTNVTSAVLGKTGGTFGVRRTDTLATVVAHNAAFNNPSTGLYSYDFEDPAAGLTYNYWIRVVYGGETFEWEKNQSGSAALEAAIYPTDLSEARNLANVLPGLASFKAADDAAALAGLVKGAMDINKGRYQGRKYDATQLLQFPRVAYETGAGPGLGGLGYGVTGSVADVIWDWDEDADEAVVPLVVKQANVYQADSILKGDWQKALDAQAMGVASKSAGSISVSYRDPASVLAALGGAAGTGLCREAAELLDKYTLRSGRIL